MVTDPFMSDVCCEGRTSTRWVNPTLSSHDTFFAEGSILLLTVTDHTALARSRTLRLRHRECAHLALLHTRAVCDQTGSFSETIMIAFFYSTLANPF